MFALFTFYFLLFTSAAFAQTKPAQPTEPALQIDPSTAQIEADQLEQIEINGQKVRRFVGNVVLKQKGQTLYANEGYQYENPKRTVFTGNVRIEQGNGQLITGDSLIIPSGTRLAKIRGNVNYIEPGRSLQTQSLDYNMDNAVLQLGAYERDLCAIGLIQR